MKSSRRCLLKLYVTPSMPHAVFSYDPPVPYVGSIEYTATGPTPRSGRKVVHVKINKYRGFLYGVEIWADRAVVVTVWAVSSKREATGRP